MYKYSNKRYYPYKKGGSTIARKSYGNFKAASQQADQGNIVVKGSRLCSVFYKENQVIAGDMTENPITVTHNGSDFVNFYQVLFENKNFQLQKQLWDEFRINKIKVKMTVANADTSLTSLDTLKSVTIVTAWDRTGLSTSQVTAINKALDDPTVSIITPEHKRDLEVYSFYTKLGPIIEEYGSKYLSNVNLYGNFSRNLSLGVKDSKEKSSWISTELIDSNGMTKNNQTGQYVMDTKQRITLEQFENDSNPTNPFENPALRWKPTLLISAYNGGMVNGVLKKAVDTNPIIFNISYEMDISFRGPRTIA